MIYRKVIIDNSIKKHIYISVFACLFLSALGEAARKALISRVVELTDDRSALILEVATLQETVSRLEGRMKEKEEEVKRCGKSF